MILKNVLRVNVFEKRAGKEKAKTRSACQGQY
jgi:hypothetical protein